MRRMYEMMQHKRGLFGIVVTIIGVGLLLFVFYTALNLFQFYAHFTINDFTAALNQVLITAIRAIFLGIMGWMGSILLVRGVDFIKVDRGVGIVTFRIEKGAGIATVTEDSEKSSVESKEDFR